MQRVAWVCQQQLILVKEETNGFIVADRQSDHKSAHTTEQAATLHDSAVTNVSGTIYSNQM